MAFARRGAPPPDADYWYQSKGHPAASGVEIDDPTTLAIPAAWNAVVLISGTIGTLPFKLLQRQSDGSKAPVREHPLFGVLNQAPNQWQTAPEYRETKQAHLLLRGNAFSQLSRSPDGLTTGLMPLHPDSVRLKVGERRIRYELTRSNGQSRPFDQNEIMHTRGLGSHGILGYSPIMLMREALGLASAAEEYAGRFFANDATPPLALVTPQALSDEAYKRMGRDWDEAHRGTSRAHRPAILEGGVTIEKLGFTQEDSQFFQSRQFQVTEIARIFNIPPHMIRDLTKSSFSNIEQQSLEYVMHTIRPWVVRWEHRADLDLLLPSERRAGLFTKFSLEGLLRGDTQARAQFYKDLWNLAVLSVNEIREFEDLNPIEGGDQRFVPLNMLPFGSAPPEPSGSDDSTRSMLLSRMADAQDEMDQSLHRPTQVAIGESRTERSLRLRRRQMLAHLPILTDMAGRIVQREVQDVRRLIGRALGDRNLTNLLKDLEAFYETFPGTVKDLALPALRGYAESVGIVAAEEINATFPDEQFDRFVDRYADTFAEGHVRSSTNQLRQLVEVTEPDALGATLDGRLDEWSETRAEKAARNEGTRLGGAVAKTVFAAAGVTAMIWRTAGLNCPLCNMFEGRRVSIIGNFAEKGQTVDPGQAGTAPLLVRNTVGHPPLHQGCDCMIVAGI